jgi:hypothetical protein
MNTESFCVSIQSEAYQLDVSGRIETHLLYCSEDGEHRKYSYETIVESAIGEGGIAADVNALMADKDFMTELESAIQNQF